MGKSLWSVCVAIGDGVGVVSKLMIPRWEATADNYPYTAKGFTGSKNVILPELAYEKGYVMAYQNGDILNIVDSKTGATAMKLEFNTKFGWVMLN